MSSVERKWNPDKLGRRFKGEMGENLFGFADDSVNQDLKKKSFCSNWGGRQDGVRLE